MTMNWRLILAVTVGLLLGAALSPFERRRVSAAVTVPANTHFQLLAAVVDELPSGQTDRLAPYNKIFLLDTESGKVWKYETARTVTRTDGSKEDFPSMFSSVAVMPQN
jgi:hypothetical protein